MLSVVYSSWWLLVDEVHCWLTDCWIPCFWVDLVCVKACFLLHLLIERLMLELRCCFSSKHSCRKARASLDVLQTIATKMNGTESVRLWVEVWMSLIKSVKKVSRWYFTPKSIKSRIKEKEFFFFFFEMTNSAELSLNINGSKYTLIYLKRDFAWFLSLDVSWQVLWDSSVFSISTEQRNWM